MKNNPLQQLINSSFYLVLNANDFFHYACAQTVTIDVADLPWILPIVEKYGDDGISAVMSFVNKELPIERWITDKFKEAHQEIVNLNLETVYSFELNE